MPPYDKFNRPARAKSERPGSKSAKHRGFRPEAEGAEAPKRRWDADGRMARAEGRQTSSGGSGRPNWEPRQGGGSNPRFGGSRDDRDARNGARGGDSGGRGSRSGGDSRDDRFSGGRDDRGFNRSGGRDERGSRDDRGGSRFGGAPRGVERDARGNRPSRDGYESRGSERGADRGARGFDRNDRGARGTDRPTGGRTEGRAPFVKRDDYGQGRPARDDRGAGSRGYDRDDRPARGDRFSRPSGDDRFSNDRSDRSDRGAGRFDRDSRPARSFDRDDRGSRPSRSFDRDDRGAGSRGFDRDSRPARSFERDDRAPRRDDRSSDFYPKRDHQHFSPEDDVKLEKLQAVVVTAGEVEGKTWGDLGLGDNLTRQLTAMGAPSPFPIQAATIPDVIAGKDVLGRGRTGSGKTIAFGAPLAEKLLEHGGAKDRKQGRKPRALILAPTRELAMQIDNTVQPIARSVGLFTTQIYGGVPQQRQVHSLQRGVDIVIGTPGRIEDLIDQGKLDLSEVTVTVLDEADHMCDLGFLEPVQRILRETADVTPHGARAQKLLFSATLDKGVAKLVDEFLTDPAVHEVAGEDQASATIDHRVLLLEQRDKFAVLEELVASGSKSLVFARTRAFAEQLADQLEDAGIPATSLHGDLNQSRRTRNLQLLTSGRVNVLVATDVAARGIHVDDIELVVQADAPDEYKTYLHRAGRTGRAGKEGTVVTLITRNRRRRMEDLLDRAEITAEMVEVRPGDALIAELAGA